MKALVYTKNKGSRIAGDIDRLISDESYEKLKHPSKMDGTWVALDIPTTMDKRYLKTAFDVLEDQWVLVEDEFAKSSDELKLKKDQLKAEMNKELYLLMAQTMGTTDFNSALLFEKTWQKMVSNPSSYSSMGITARFDRGVYGASNTQIMTGDALDTDEKVQAYAQACLDAADAAEAQRMQRIEQYKQDLAALLAQYAGSI